MMVTEMSVATDNRPSFSLSFDDKLTLYKQYMPFIQNGGLFIPTSKTFCLGDAVSLSLALPDVATAYSCSGRVVWITPPAAERGLVAGIGVQLLGEETSSLCHQIETGLASMLGTLQMRDTL
ncbi:MAG: PilZ domain-containing protein [Gammaproteobacteria bacterium]|nr:PilZ domain-containing protein [Gammaproteobacteria bacterium]